MADSIEEILSSPHPVGTYPTTVMPADCMFLTSVAMPGLYELPGPPSGLSTTTMGTTGCASFAWMISFTWLNRELEFSVNSGTMTPVLSGAEASDAAGGVVAPAANGPYAIDDGASESENGTSEEEPAAGVEEVEVTEDERLEKENATPEPTII